MTYLIMDNLPIKSAGFPQHFPVFHSKLLVSVSLPEGNQALRGPRHGCLEVGPPQLRHSGIARGVHRCVVVLGTEDRQHRQRRLLRQRRSHGARHAARRGTRCGCDLLEA